MDTFLDWTIAGGGLILASLALLAFVRLTIVFAIDLFRTDDKHLLHLARHSLHHGHRAWHAFHRGTRRRRH